MDDFAKVVLGVLGFLLLVGFVSRFAGEAWGLAIFVFLIIWFMSDSKS